MVVMSIHRGDFELTLEELRAVARYGADCAQEVLSLFEDVHPDDPRPRAAIDAAVTFADGGSRTNLQRVTALDTHRAAKDATIDAARYAAASAGDAAAAAYLHPLAKATQVGHILRAAANAAYAKELSAGNDPNVGDAHLAQARGRATSTVIEVLRRYPLAPVGKSRVAHLMTALDHSLRAP
jgi:hypothetical protein